MRETFIFLFFYVFYLWGCSLVLLCFICIKSVRKDFRKQHCEKFSCLLFLLGRQQNTKVQLLPPYPRAGSESCFRRRQLHPAPRLFGRVETCGTVVHAFSFVVCHHDAPCGRSPGNSVCGDGAARAEGEVGDGETATERVPAEYVNAAEVRFAVLFVIAVEISFAGC